MLTHEDAFLLQCLRIFATCIIIILFQFCSIGFTKWPFYIKKKKNKCLTLLIRTFNLFMLRFIHKSYIYIYIRLDFDLLKLHSIIFFNFYNLFITTQRIHSNCCILIVSNSRYKINKLNCWAQMMSKFLWIFNKYIYKNYLTWTKNENK